jgi:hypothetical protein
MSSDPAKAVTSNRTFQITLAVAIGFLLIGGFLVWRLSTFSPADVQAAAHLQDEGNAWRSIEAKLKRPHSREDEIAAYEGFLKQFPPGKAPTKREAQAQRALATINAQRADAPPPRP